MLELQENTQQTIVKQILEQLEQVAAKAYVCAWHKQTAGLPINARTKQACRGYNDAEVFNKNQLAGYVVPKYTLIKDINIKNSQHVDKIIKETGANIRHEGNGAFYNFVEDILVLPDKNRFISLSRYYSTIFHELIHWTGHKSRLNRQLNSPQQSEKAFEELVAELGAIFCCVELDLINKPDINHVRYIKCWINVLMNDENLIVQAAKLASKASQFILKG